MALQYGLTPLTTQSSVLAAQLQNQLKETAEEEKADQAQETAQEEASKETEAAESAQETESAQTAKAETQRQEILRLQERVGEKLEDILRNTGKDNGSEKELASLMSQAEAEGADSFTPENLQKLREMSQQTQAKVDQKKEQDQKAQAQRQTDASEQLKRANQELKNNLRTQNEAVQKQAAQAKNEAAQAKNEARQAAQDVAKKGSDVKTQVKAEAKAEAQNKAAVKAEAKAEKAQSQAAVKTDKAMIKAESSSAGEAAKAAKAAKTQDQSAVKAEAAQAKETAQKNSQPAATKPETVRAKVTNEAKAEAEAEAKAETKAEVKAEAKAEAKTEVKAELKPEVKAEAKPEAKPQVKAEVKPEVKPQVKAENKPEVKAQVQAESKPEVKLQAQAEFKPQVKEQIKAEAKQEAKPQVKAELKPEVKAQVKAEAKPEARPQVNAEAKPEAKPQVKAEAKPEVKLQAQNEVKRAQIAQTAKQESAKVEAKREMNVAVAKQEAQNKETAPAVKLATAPAVRMEGHDMHSQVLEGQAFKTEAFGGTHKPAKAETANVSSEGGVSTASVGAESAPLTSVENDFGSLNELLSPWEGGKGGTGAGRNDVPNRGMGIMGGTAAEGAPAPEAQGGMRSKVAMEQEAQRQIIQPAGEQLKRAPAVQQMVALNVPQSKRGLDQAGPVNAMSLASVGVEEVTAATGNARSSATAGPSLMSAMTAGVPVDVPSTSDMVMGVKGRSQERGPLGRVEGYWQEEQPQKSAPKPQKTALYKAQRTAPQTQPEGGVRAQSMPKPEGGVRAQGMPKSEVSVSSVGLSGHSRHTGPAAPKTAQGSSAPLAGSPAPGPAKNGSGSVLNDKRQPSPPPQHTPSSHTLTNPAPVLHSPRHEAGSAATGSLADRSGGFVNLSSDAGSLGSYMGFMRSSSSPKAPRSSLFGSLRNEGAKISASASAIKGPVISAPQISAGKQSNVAGVSSPQPLSGVSGGISTVLPGNYMVSGTLSSASLPIMTTGSAGMALVHLRPRHATHNAVANSTQQAQQAAQQAQAVMESTSTGGAVSSEAMSAMTATRSTIAQGVAFGGRSVTTNIPIYSSILDTLYSPKGKAALNKAGTPIKMVLTGMVGSLEQESYTEQASRMASVAQSHNLNGVMSSSNKSSSNSVRRSEVGAKGSEGTRSHSQGGEVKTVEAAKGRGQDGEGGGSRQGDQRGAQGTAERARAAKSMGTSSSALLMQDKARLSSIRLASDAKTFDISMSRLTTQAAQRSFALATQEGITPATVLIKRVYRRQQIEELDESEALNGVLLMMRLSGSFAYDHASRVLDYSLDLADEMGIRDPKTRQQIEQGAVFKDIGELTTLWGQQSDDKIEALADFMNSTQMRQATMLHDIGLTDVPANLHLPEQELTPEQYERYKMHPVIGEGLIYPIVSLRHLCPVIRGHHERWDGKGFPDQKSAQDIPLAARILAVTDAFDALYSDAQAQGHMDVEEIKGVLLAGGGTQFDPECVKSFVKVLDRRFASAVRRPRRFAAKMGSRAGARMEERSAGREVSRPSSRRASAALAATDVDMHSQQCEESFVELETVSSDSGRRRS